MRSYNLVLLLKSDIKKEQKEKLLESVLKWAGKIDKEKVNPIGEKKLAYPIKREKKGDYVAISFEAERVDDELEKKLKVNDSILRHLLIRN